MPPNRKSNHIIPNSLRHISWTAVLDSDHLSRHVPGMTSSLYGMCKLKTETLETSNTGWRTSCVSVLVALTARNGETRRAERTSKVLLGIQHIGDTITTLKGRKLQ